MEQVLRYPVIFKILEKVNFLQRKLVGLFLPFCLFVCFLGFFGVFFLGGVVVVIGFFCFVLLLGKNKVNASFTVKGDIHVAVCVMQGHDIMVQL